MASPDATPYIDLLLRDLDPQDIVDLIVADLLTKIPQWVPRETNIEMVVIESMAVGIAELMYATNRIPSAVVQVLLKLAGIEYDEGAQPSASILFNLNDTSGTTIPASTSVRLDLDGLDPIVFTTGPEYTVQPGATTAVVEATGDRYTTDGNGVAAGTDLTLLDSLTAVETVALATTVAGGRDEEDDDDYFQRGTQLFTRLTNCLVLPSQFVASMLEEVYVLRAYAVDNYDVTQDPEGQGPAGQDAGHITVLAYGDNEFLTGDQQNLIITKMQSLSMSALQVHYIDPTITAVDVTANIYIEDGYDASDVIDSVRATLTDFLSPMTWNWKNVARRNDIISVITNTVGVDFVDTLSEPASNQALPGVVALATAGDISITVLTD